MRTKLRVTLLIFALLVTVGALAPTAQSQDADTQAIRTVIEGFGIAFSVEMEDGNLPEVEGVQLLNR